MKNLIIGLFISGSVLAQNRTTPEYSYAEFNALENVKDQEAYYEEMRKANPDADYDTYLTALAIANLDHGNTDKYKFYTRSNPEFSAIALINLVYALEHLEVENENMPVIAEVSQEVIDKIESRDEIDVIANGRLQVLLELNAMANAKLGNVALAKKNLEKSSEIVSEFRDSKYFKDSKASYYDRCALVLAAAGETQRAMDTLVKAVRTGESKPKLRETFAQVYKELKGTDAGCEDLIKELREEAYQHYYDKIKKTYLTDVEIPYEGKVDAPNGSGEKLTIFSADKNIYDISLPDLNGNKVNLADHKGEILLIDFWTTMCTPCVACFAAFENVVEDYKDEPFQLYIINLFEFQEDVKSFVKKKGIDLDVLHDEENLAYNVVATPTKIVFDPQGTIRFYNIAYAGSTDGEYYKVKAMIEIIKEHAPSLKK